MQRLILTASGIALSAVLALASPAQAEGKGDRAQQAIAAASAKVDTAAKIGAIGDVPHLVAQAEAALRAAKEDVAAGHKSTAIEDANKASMLADTAIGISQKHKAEAVQDARADAAAATAAAQDSAAAANARADAAQQAAAASAADAAAARAAPPVIVAPQPTTTTVSTETVKSVNTTARPKKIVRVVKKRPTTTHVAERTTTTVTTTPNQ
jgi:hypothetical protein